MFGELSGGIDVLVESSGRTTVGPDFAVPFGLLLSELVTNAVKHAFPGGRAGRVKVTIESGSEVVLLVEDDGIGIPRAIEPKSPSNLGLRIVGSLVTQLGGRIELDSNGAPADAWSNGEDTARTEIRDSSFGAVGTCWRLNFPRTARTGST